MSKLSCLVFFLSLTGFSQVVNVETLRKVSDSSKWTGSASLDISLIKNRNNIFRMANKAHVQYNDQTNLWLFVNDLNFQKIEDDDLINRGTQHLRYNRKISERIKWEVFGQAQYDAISQINFRGLIGTGPRIKISKSEDYRFYLGTLIMYEYEEASNINTDRIQKDVR